MAPTALIVRTIGIKACYIRYSWRTVSIVTIPAQSEAIEISICLLRTLDKLPDCSIVTFFATIAGKRCCRVSVKIVHILIAVFDILGPPRIDIVSSLTAAGLLDEEYLVCFQFSFELGQAVAREVNRHVH